MSHFAEPVVADPQAAWAAYVERHNGNEEAARNAIAAHFRAMHARSGAATCADGKRAIAVSASKARAPLSRMHAEPAQQRAGPVLDRRHGTRW